MDSKDLLRSNVEMHRARLAGHVERLKHVLTQRAILHDLSKLTEAEFDGFSDVAWAVKNSSPGEEVFQRAMSHKCIDIHKSRNRHHPERHGNLDDMNFIDIIEMVFDWQAASEVYGNGGLMEKLDPFITKHGFNEGQEWLIRQVAAFLNDQGLLV